MKIAIVYDRVNKWGGAERVLLALHEIFPEAPLYTSVYAPSGTKWAKVFPEVKTTLLNKIKFFRDKHEFLAPFMPIAFESLDFSSKGRPASGWDLVISVTSESAKGIITGPNTKHICYCLTPTRYLWSHYDEYFHEPLRFMTKPIVSYLRYWDKIASKRPDKIIAISKEVKKRIKKYYRRNSLVIYPPVEIKNLKERKIEHKKYFLVVSRLVSYKKVDLVIDAFNDLDLPLVIVGTGKEEGKLKRKARGNIKFAGFVPEKKLGSYYKNAKALIMPQEEDFGLVAVEAQMYGIPVIAYKAGGVLDVITKNTGVFFKNQNKEGLITALKKFDTMRFDAKVLLKNAQRFSKERFKKEFLDLISSL